MEYLHIRGELLKNNVSLSAIARELGITMMGVKQVAIGNSRSLRTAQAIADKMKQPLTVVFPEYKNATKKVAVKK